MGEVRKVTVELGDELAVDIDTAVAVGDYATIDQVVQKALRDWQQQRQADIARLRALWEEGLASGEGGEVTDEWFEDIIRRGEERLAQKRTAE